MDIVEKQRINLKTLCATLSPYELELLNILLNNDLIYEVIDIGCTALRVESRAVLSATPKKDFKTYFLKSTVTGLIKIGKSHCPENRMQTISTMIGSNLELLLVIDTDIENKLHKKFEKYRKHGEWFDDFEGVIEKFIVEYNT